MHLPTCPPVVLVFRWHSLWLGPPGRQELPTGGSWLDDAIDVILCHILECRDLSFDVLYRSSSVSASLVAHMRVIGEFGCVEI